MGFLAYFFALNIGKTPQTKNGGYENGGLLTLDLRARANFMRNCECRASFEIARGSSFLST